MGGGDVLPGPDFDGVVAATGDETTLAAGASTRYNAAGLCGGCPGHCVAADHVCREELGVPGAVVFEFKDRDFSIATCTGEDGADFVRGPLDGVDCLFRVSRKRKRGSGGGTGGVVVGVLKELVPDPVALLPDYHFAVVGGASEDVSEFRVSPGDLPNGAFVAGRRRVG